ncbi:MAG: ribonuclease III [Phenylobacterium sp.]|nr:MAG: ribonuclease III [Phenylobacterium sp.]
MTARAAAVAQLEQRIGHVFADRDLLERALTHASVGDRAPSASHNERLEFLGDRVLNLIVADELMEKLPEAPEGELTKLFHTLINAHACAVVAREVGLDAALRMGGGAGKTGMRKNERVLGDACEALIAALYLDGGLELARRFVLTAWAIPLANLNRPTKDPKTMLNEWALSRGRPAPVYRVVSQEGLAHEPRFQIEVFVEGLTPEVAAGGSKKEGEQRAAEQLLQRAAEAP